MVRSTLFKSNRSQAVRLPKPVALPEGVHHVEIVTVGNTRIVSPAGQSWDAFFDGARPSDDFMTGRSEPPAQERDPL